MDSENIMKKVYNEVIHFLQSMLGIDKMAIVNQKLNEAYPTWTDLWKAIHNWLVTEHPLTNMQHSIKSFAQLFPNYESFAGDLENSLSLHDEFWNKVYIYLCAAQQGLKC